ncbi:MAG: hypothetical protein R3258_08795 [Acidimicrobiia bacterium]|nr:hypothetical protein [Acidimicrobiia bacterium]
MSSLSVAEMASTTLDECDEVLTELHDNCCVPNRSPRMEALQQTLDRVRADIGKLDTDPQAHDRILGELKGAGAVIGELQIECCAPARMPLYAELLAGLSRTQRMVAGSQGGMEH